jgi:hypothetical protein
MNSSSTRPMKKGRPAATGPYPSRADFEEACVERFQRGWRVNRIAYQFKVSWNTVGDLLKKQQMI